MVIIINHFNISLKDNSFSDYLLIIANNGKKIDMLFDDGKKLNSSQDISFLENVLSDQFFIDLFKLKAGISFSEFHGNNIFLVIDKLARHSKNRNLSAKKKYNYF